MTDWRTGQAVSVRAGLTAAAATGAAATLVHLVDLPDVGPEVVARVIADVDATSLIRAVYHGSAGPPGGHRPRSISTLCSAPCTAIGAPGATWRQPADVRLIECGDLATGDDVDHD